MNKLLLITLLVLQIQSQEVAEEEAPIFRGCTSDFFPDQEDPRSKGIDFSEQCLALENCAESFSSTKEECLQDFEAAQELFCSTYTGVNLWRRRYCFRVVTENMKVARALDNELFNSAFEAFIAMVSDDGTNCLINEEDAAAAANCDNTLDEQKFLFVQLSNGKFVIKDSEGACLDFESNFVDCDYDAEEQMMSIALGETGVNEAVILNKDEDFLLVQASGDGDTEFDDATSEVIISVVSSLGEEVEEPKEPEA